MVQLVNLMSDSTATDTGTSLVPTPAPLEETVIAPLAGLLAVIFTTGDELPDPDEVSGVSHAGEVRLQLSSPPPTLKISKAKERS